MPGQTTETHIENTSNSSSSSNSLLPFAKSHIEILYAVAQWTDRKTQS